MADFSLVLTVPDAKLNDFIAALRAAWGPIEDGVDGDGNPVLRDKTPAELKAEATQRQNDAFRDIYKRWKIDVAEEAARDATDADIDIT